MKKLFIVILMLGSALIAGEVKYICPANGFISAIVDGIDVKPPASTSSTNFTLKTNWYGQPIYLREDKKKNSLMYKSIQSKLEWVESDIMTFEGAFQPGLDVKEKILIEKGNAPIIQISWNTTNTEVRAKSMTMKMQCYKQ